jgi:hypothetical protein
MLGQEELDKLEHNLKITYEKASKFFGAFIFAKK